MEIVTTERALSYDELQARRARRNFEKLEVVAVCFQLRSNKDPRTGDLAWRFVVGLKAISKTAFKTKEAPEEIYFQVPAQPLREGVSIADMVLGVNNYGFHYLNRTDRDNKDAIAYMGKIVASYKNAGVKEVEFYEDGATSDLQEAFESYYSGKCSSSTAHLALLKKIWPECVVEVPVKATSVTKSAPATVNKALQQASDEVALPEQPPRKKSVRAPRISNVQTA